MNAAMGRASSVYHPSHALWQNYMRRYLPTYHSTILTGRMSHHGLDGTKAEEVSLVHTRLRYVYYLGWLCGVWGSPICNSASCHPWK